MRLDINLERMVIHRNILLQVSRGNIPDDEIFRLWNNECCYTDVYGAIYQMFFFRLWNDERCYTGVWGQYIR